MGGQSPQVLQYDLGVVEGDRQGVQPVLVSARELKYAPARAAVGPREADEKSRQRPAGGAELAVAPVDALEEGGVERHRLAASAAVDERIGGGIGEGGERRSTPLSGR